MSKNNYAAAGKKPMTNAEYAAFVEANGSRVEVRENIVNGHKVSVTRVYADPKKPNSYYQFSGSVADKPAAPDVVRAFEARGARADRAA